MTFVYLILAIVAEVIATSALKASVGFTRPLPSLLVVGGYGVAFYLLSLVLRTLPVGITYAIWAGLGIVLVTLVGIVVFGEKPDLPAVFGISLIVAGVVTLQVFSKMNVH
ncbi:MAG: multidrug efflux SMR transporter [Pseudomonadota bacterium]|jgi:small multidrug resistance pump|uniref:Small multidrug resistance pump n=2 Tax=Vreelandella TaxID=3137766 RepID=A0A1N6DHF6_9GAMM|nr:MULTISPECIES: multidrug efflux SMR transporter [Halomonas]MEC8936866.1 multidrug efflux SMR transporter [Pseudomonadota bacterium]MBV66572.1 QacE family quaternary ammonium compound efflux SMR transporter [Halomonas sp.]MCP1302484.1 multidrug efflux SMR transporter [Halomonas sp. R1t8]MCP1316659.1 multidrug efflux SMR transporter [Halomonas sp. 707B3]MCP1329019.1 multidrug efflux SMR transporter [Halomonas sp. R1t4]|tara:strand:- start:353 stop:682 length:330 start_codon:yes stop_codon:yes gene_type:complete